MSSFITCGKYLRWTIPLHELQNDWYEWLSTRLWILYTNPYVDNVFCLEWTGSITLAYIRSACWLGTIRKKVMKIEKHTNIIKQLKIINNSYHRGHTFQWVHDKRDNPSENLPALNIEIKISQWHSRKLPTLCPQMLWCLTLAGAVMIFYKMFAQVFSELFVD